jgi:hypothetical protein
LRLFLRHLRSSPRCSSNWGIPPVASSAVLRAPPSIFFCVRARLGASFS